MATCDLVVAGDRSKSRKAQQSSCPETEALTSREVCGARNVVPSIAVIAEPRILQERRR